MSKHFLRQLADKLPHRLIRFGMNLWPPFLGAGIKVVEISSDWRHIDTRLKLHWYNKNLVGTHFGGSIFSLVDAFPMIMLIRHLGSNYIVWDKAATIQFKKPGRTTISASFTFSQEEIENIKTKADLNEKYIFDYPVDVKDIDNNIIATVTKTIYVRRKVQSSNE